jgi:DNA-binding beta-propeller fold protein YncE
VPSAGRRTASVQRICMAKAAGWAALVLVAACTTAGADESAGHHATNRGATGPALPTSTVSSTPRSASPRKTTTTPPTGASRRTLEAPFRHPLPGMPPALHNNVYAATARGMLARRVSHDRALLYVPDSGGTTTTVVDQRTHRIVRVIDSGQLSQHVNPSYDLRTLFVDASAANHLLTIDPSTGKPERRVAVPRPYNVYFTPDGKQAVVMVEQYNRILFADPRTFMPLDRLQVPGCSGPNHADFSANGRSMVITCEFSAVLLKISLETHQVQARVQLPAGSIPQDVRLAPDGRIFYVADMGRDLVRLYNWRRLRPVGRIHTPAMPHGLIPSRDARFLYVTDRGAGRISVVSFARERIVDTWVIPGGGSPDMGGVSADGRFLWVSGRYDGVVYGFHTGSGKLVARIRVGGSPHGLLVWPQPGRYSLGHTGNMR